MAWRTPDFVWQTEREDALVGDHLSEDWSETPIRNLLQPGLSASNWERIRAKTDTSDQNACWVWTGYVDPDGYGRISVANRKVYIHRLSYEYHNGPIPEGMTVDHVAARGCTSKACVNPTHLEVVTRAENARRGHAYRERPTHCPLGHPFDEENTYHDPRPGKGRRCRTCERVRNRARYAASLSRAADPSPESVATPPATRTAPGDELSSSSSGAVPTFTNESRPASTRDGS